MTTVNLYDVLNIPEDATIQAIKSAYKDLAKKFHPDKPGGDSDMFELVTHAYNILVDPSSKSEYDKIYNLNKQSKNHKSLKEAATNYYENNKAASKEKDKEKEIENKKSFEKNWESMDKKHNYKRGLEDQKLDEDSTKRRLQDLQLSREQDIIECTTDEMFEPGKFNSEKFNSAFDLIHGSSNSLTAYTGVPGAWNDSSTSGASFSSNFSSVNNYEDLYVEDDDKGNLNKDLVSKKKISKREVDKLGSAEYNKKHNYREPGYVNSLEDKLRERELETKKYDDRTMSAFDTSPDCGGFSIFKNLGLDPSSSNLMLNMDNDQDIKDKYAKLVDYRKGE